MYSNYIDGLSGKQLPAVLQELASEENLPTFRSFLQGEEYSVAAFAPYCEALQAAKQDATLKNWREEAAKVSTPVQILACAQSPSNTSLLAAAQGISWDRGLQVWQWIGLKYGLVPLGRTKAGKLSTRPSSSCLLCGQGYGGRLSHILSCNKLKTLHEDFDATIQGKLGQNDVASWDRAILVFSPRAPGLQTRLKYAHDISQALSKAAASAE